MEQSFDEESVFSEAIRSLTSLSKPVNVRNYIAESMIMKQFFILYNI